MLLSFITGNLLFNCLSNRKYERLGGPLDEIVTVFVHKYKVIMPRPNMTSFDSRDRLPRRWLLHFYRHESWTNQENSLNLNLILQSFNVEK